MKMPFSLSRIGHEDVGAIWSYNACILAGYDRGPGGVSFENGR